MWILDWVRRWFSDYSPSQAANQLAMSSVAEAVNPFCHMNTREALELINRSNAVLNIVDFPRLCGSNCNNENTKLRINKRVVLAYADDDMSYYLTSVLLDGVKVGSIRASSILEFRTSAGSYALETVQELRALPVGTARLLFDICSFLSAQHSKMRDAEEKRARSVSQALNTY